MGLRQSLYYSAPIAVQNLLVSAYGYYLRRQRFGAGAREVAALVERSENWTRAEADAYQLDRMRQILAQAAKGAPYYRDSLSSSRSAVTLSSLDDLRNLPILTKEVVRREGDRMRITGVRPHWTQYTSGSTGTPLVVHVNRFTFQLIHALLARHEERCGVKRGDWRATFAGRLVQPVEKLTPPFWRYNYADRQILFSAYHLSDATVPLYLDELSRRQPSELIGYPSAISTVAAYAIRAGLTGRVRPLVVVTNSETLFSRQRHLIEEAFQCPVRDYYGTAEAVVFAAQCQRGAYHFNPLLGIGEILDADGTPVAPGETGRLICTTVSNDAMPLLRYEIGDEATRLAGPCPCGSPLDGAEAIVGRQDDAIVTADGRSVGRMDHIFKGVVGVRECQIIQEELGFIRLLLVPDAEFTSKQHQLIIENTRERLGPELRVEIERVAAVPRTKAGKFIGVVSKVRRQSA